VSLEDKPSVSVTVILNILSPNPKPLTVKVSVAVPDSVAGAPVN